MSEAVKITASHLARMAIVYLRQSSPRQVREMQRRHQDVGDAFIAFVLKMVLGHPEGVVTDTIHQLGHRLGLVEDAGQGFVGKSTVVHRSAGIAGIFHVDVSSEQAVKFRNHARSSRESADRASTGHLRPPFTRGNPEPLALPCPRAAGLSGEMFLARWTGWGLAEINV